MNNQRFYLILFITTTIGLTMISPLVSSKSPSLDEKIENESKKLDSIRMEITQREAEFKLQNQKEKSIFTELRLLDESERKLNQELKVFDLKIKKNEGYIESLNQDIQILISSIEEQKNTLTNRLRGLYMLGRYSYQRILLSSSSYSDFIYRYKLLKLVAKEDRKIISDFKETIQALQAKSEELNISNDQLISLTEKLYVTREELNKKKKEKTSLLANVKMEKKIALEVINELKEYEEDLTKLVKYLNIHKSKVIRGEEEKILYSRFGNFPAMKGKLSYPVDGKIALGFGKIKHPEFNVYTEHNGIDFNAEYGSDVKAVYGGSVVFAKWFKSYGNLVIIDHFGGFFTLYAHLSEILVKQGSLVEEGAVIGKVGDTGSLKGPILYFELRYKNVPQNAMNWFKKRR